MDATEPGNKSPSIVWRFWWSIVCMSFWQWGLLSIVLGGLGIWLYGQRDTVPRNPDDRVTLDTFLADLNGDRLPNGKSSVSDVEIYPWNDGVRLVTYKLATVSGNSIGYTTHFLYEISRTGTPPVKISEIAAAAGVTSQAVHWIGPPIKQMCLWGGGAVIGVGVVWPVVLHRLRKTGHAPQVPERALAPVSPGAPVVLSASEMAVAAPAAVQLSSEPLVESAAERIEKEKKYRGEFYPVEHPGENAGFTLAELLVVIGVIGILIALIFPALAGARRAAEQLQCASNLRNIGMGIVIYLDQNQGTFPPAYLYVGEQIDDGVETPANASAGYVHWSTYLYGTGTIPQAAAFQCPALDRGGLPPDDTTDDNLDQGQVSGSPGIVDQQVTRLAYTLNEALCPRNKFVLGFQGAQRIYQYVKATQVADSSETILGTEWAATGARIGETTGSGFETVSHRPVTGFIGTDGTQEMYLLSPSTAFRQVTVADLDPDPTSAASSTTRLDWVGRNHGKLQGYPDKRLSNFLYVDGHVETKSIYETLTPFQWGKQFYSLNPNDDLETQQP